MGLLVCLWDIMGDPVGAIVGLLVDFIPDKLPAKMNVDKWGGRNRQQIEAEEIDNKLYIDLNWLTEKFR